MCAYIHRSVIRIGAGYFLPTRHTVHDLLTGHRYKSIYYFDKGANSKYAGILLDEDNKSIYRIFKNGMTSDKITTSGHCSLPDQQHYMVPEYRGYTIGADDYYVSLRDQSHSVIHCEEVVEVPSSNPIIGWTWFGGHFVVFTHDVIYDVTTRSVIYMCEEDWCIQCMIDDIVLLKKEEWCDSARLIPVIGKLPSE
jgi:hypothetical protein